MPTPHDEFKIAPIHPGFLQKLRETGIDDLQQTAETSIAEGGEPCRDVLRRARPGEKLILASYCPFALAGPYREYGPVFVLAEHSEEQAGHSSLPFGEGRNYITKTFVLRAYSESERIVEGLLTSVEDAESSLRGLFARDDVAFVLARFAGYGCYACRFERA